MATTGRRQRARRGTGASLHAGSAASRIDLGLDADGKRIRPNRTFDTRPETQARIEKQLPHAREPCPRPVAAAPRLTVAVSARPCTTRRAAPGRARRTGSCGWPSPAWSRSSVGLPSRSANRRAHRSVPWWAAACLRDRLIPDSAVDEAAALLPDPDRTPRAAPGSPPSEGCPTRDHQGQGTPSHVGSTAELPSEGGTSGARFCRCPAVGGQSTRHVASQQDDRIGAASRGVTQLDVTS